MANIKLVYMTNLMYDAKQQKNPKNTNHKFPPSPLAAFLMAFQWNVNIGEPNSN